MNIINVAVLIHGMIPDRDARDSTLEFRAFWEKMKGVNPAIGECFRENDIHFISWGHEPLSHNGNLRIDQKLTVAEKNVASLVDYKHVRENPGPNNVVMSGLFGGDPGVPFVRRMVVNMRETIIQLGLADVVYYCSAEGESQVRNVVFSKVLRGLEQYEKEPAQVRLHVIGHSLGVTIAHDFLYGLFKRGHISDFIKQGQGEPKAMEAFLLWRSRAAEGELRLGSFTAMASQLPLFVMRKHSLIELFHADRERLNPEDIGIRGTGTRWQIFHDVDDILGFASRDLYHDKGNNIRQVQVNAGFGAKAHTEYTSNATVIRETVKLLLTNCG